MIVNVVDDMCQVWKFTKTQFRSKTYDVKIIDCYPVLPSIPPSFQIYRHIPVAPESDDSSSEETDTIPKHIPNSQPSAGSEAQQSTPKQPSEDADEENCPSCPSDIVEPLTDDHTVLSDSLPPSVDADAVPIAPTLFRSHQNQ